MFYLSYLFSELRRRKGRTLLTALGLGVGVGLVVTVSALTTGLDRAQDEVLEPLRGVGTDMSVTRPLNNNGQGAGELSAKERKQLDQENGRARFDLNSQAKPGAKFSRTDFLKLAQLQAISGRKGRVNSAQVRAKSTDDVAAVEKRSDASTPSATSTEGSSDDQSL